MSNMKDIRIEKLTVNIGAGKSTDKLEKGVKLIKSLFGIDPVKTITQKRIPTWGLRPGLPIGCKLTLRKEAARVAFERLVTAKDHKLIPSNVDGEGNVSFGLHEYIDIPGAKYDPAIGIMGLQVCMTLERPGFRIKRRRLMKKKIPVSHRISQEDAMAFITKEFKVKFVEEE